VFEFDKYEIEVINNIKEFIENEHSLININDLINKVGIRHEGSMADVRSILQYLIANDFLQFNFDIRYLSLSTFGKIYFNYISYEDNKYGDRFTIKEFLEHVQSGCITDFDGCGYYGNVNQKSNISVTCNEDEIIKMKNNKTFSHVYWFNK